MQEMQERRVRSLGREDPLEEDIANHSSVLTWRVPWTEEPGGLQSIGSHSQTQLKLLSMRVPVTSISHCDFTANDKKVNHLQILKKGRTL